MSSVKPPRRPEVSVTIAQLREVGLFGALSDEFLELLEGHPAVEKVKLRPAEHPQPPPRKRWGNGESNGNGWHGGQ